jgi:hypothetical protein
VNDITKFSGNLPTNPDELAKGLAGVSQGLQNTTTGVPFLSLKAGVFVYGPEKIEVEEGSRWAVNPYSIHHGFACWGDGELLGEVMARFDQPPPRQDQLQDYGQPWGQQISMELKCVSGEDAGITVLYKSTSVGMRNAAKALIDQIVNQAQADAEHIVPVVELECDSYQHKKYGETFFPVLDPIEWLTMGGPEAEEAAANASGAEESPVADDDPPKPAKRRGKAKAESAQPTDNDGKPASNSRRRRRRAE